MRDLLRNWFATPGGTLFLRQSMRISAALFVAGLVTPAVYFGDPGGWLWGVYLLIVGMLGFADGHFAWFANVFYAVAGMFLRSGKPGTAMAPGIIALAFAGSFVFYDSLDWEGRDPIVHWGPGYYLWLGAIAVQILGAHGRRIAPERL